METARGNIAFIWLLPHPVLNQVLHWVCWADTTWGTNHCFTSVFMINNHLSTILPWLLWKKYS